MKRMTMLAGLLAVVGMTGFAQAQIPDASKLVQAELLALTQGYEPGKPVRIGVKFKIAPKWHIYWHNPGDSGQETVVKLTLPEGWKQGAWEFPLPKKFMQPGDFIGYGYEEEVVLFTTVTPSETAQGEAVIKATAIYLVCEATCIPGQAQVSLKLSQGKTEDSPNKALLEKWTAKLPMSDQIKVQSGQTLKPGDPAKELVVTLPAQDAWKDVEVFPFPSSSVDLQKVEAKIENNDRGRIVVIKINAKLYSGQTETEPKIRLLVVTSESGKASEDHGTSGRSGRWVDLPLSAARP